MYHQRISLFQFISFLMLIGISATQAQILIRYPIKNAQTASVTIPDQVAPGLIWDFLRPSHEGGLDYGSPNGFLRDHALGGYLAQKWPSSATSDQSKYFEFSIQPREHCIAQLEGISMAILSTVRTYGQSARALSPQRWEVRLSLSNAPEQEWPVFSEPTHLAPSSSYTVHLFENAGEFSTAPLIPERTTATFRIYAFNAEPLTPDEEGLPEIYATGGLIHTGFEDTVLGQDLILHGTLHCKKETYRYLSSANIDHPLLETIKLRNSINSINPAYLSMIPEPQATYWAFGLLCTVVAALKRARK